MQQVMAGLIPSTCFPDIYLPEEIYLRIVDQHKERMYDCYDEVTNDDTMYPETHHYWTHQPFENPAITLNSTQNAETETKDEKSSDGKE